MFFLGLSLYETCCIEKYIFYLGLSQYGCIEKCVLYLGLSLYDLWKGKEEMLRRLGLKKEDSKYKR